MLGRNTFTTTSLPSHKRAACTCATEADAIGSVSKYSNTSATGLPKAFSTKALDCSLENGGTRSCKRANSTAISSGNKSRRVESICPNLI